MTPFVIQDVWVRHYDTYCVDCAYHQTHISHVPYGEASAEYHEVRCALLDDPGIPETECAAHADWMEGDE